MDEACIPGRDDHIFKHFVARYDVPAYVRRAWRVHEAFEDLVSRCRKKREEWLTMVRVYAKAVLGLAGDGATEELRDLATMLDLPQPCPGIAGSKRRLGRALRELNESIVRFNERWRRYLDKVDLSAVNRLRSDYNRYYVLEKECALRSARLARLGFQPLVPVTVAELYALIPALPVVSACA
jgi:hypothetical protein